MDIQSKEALIAEIERFKTESLKTHIVQVWAESYTNTDPFGYVILEKENNKVWWMKTQAYQLWKMWNAAQAVPAGFVLVPKHPNLKILKAMSAEMIKPNNGRIFIGKVYKAMLEAAQEPANV